MGNPAQRTAHIKDTVDLLAAIQNGTLPAVSFGKPDGLLDGHPSSSKVDLFEAYDSVRSHYPIDENRLVIRGFSMGGPACWQNATARVRSPSRK